MHFREPWQISWNQRKQRLRAPASALRWRRLLQAATAPRFPSAVAGSAAFAMRRALDGSPVRAADRRIARAIGWRYLHTQSTARTRQQPATQPASAGFCRLNFPAPIPSARPTRCRGIFFRIGLPQLLDESVDSRLRFLHAHSRLQAANRSGQETECAHRRMRKRIICKAGSTPHFHVALESSGPGGGNSAASRRRSCKDRCPCERDGQAHSDHRRIRASKGRR